MVAKTDSELKAFCFKALVDLVGHVDMERFIVLMNREPRDYTKWRESHFNEDADIHELAEKIRAFSPRRIRTADGRCPRILADAGVMPQR